MKITAVGHIQREKGLAWMSRTFDVETFGATIQWQEAKVQVAALAHMGMLGRIHSEKKKIESRTSI